MTKTREEIIIGITSKLVNKKYETLAWNDITSAISNASQDDRSLLLNKLRGRNVQQFAKVFFKIINQSVEAVAETEANDMMLDDNLTLIDLQKFL